jgi:hypothetical protein
MKIINLTPHDVTIRIFNHDWHDAPARHDNPLINTLGDPAYADIVYPASGVVSRLKTESAYDTYVTDDAGNKVEIYTTGIGEVIARLEEIPGWIWTDEKGNEYSETGSWDELPAWPDSAAEEIERRLNEQGG